MLEKHGFVSDDALSMRPAWPDEVTRARALAGVALAKALLATEISGGEYFVLVNERPVERLVGVIAWGQKASEGRTAVFAWWLLPAYQQRTVDFLQAFRRFILEENAHRFHSLHAATLFGEQAPQAALLEEAGFAKGLLNETYAVEVPSVLARIEEGRSRFGARLRLPPGARLAPVEKAHLPKLVELCANHYGLISSASLHSAFDSADSSEAGFDPAISRVYLEEDEVRGALLFQWHGNDVRVPVRAVAPGTKAAAGLVCHWLFEQCVESVRSHAPSLFLFRADPASHAETVRMARRYGGKHTGTLARFEARRSRPVHAFCIGNARCGTVTLAALLNGPLHANHEPEREPLIGVLRRRIEGKLSDAELDAWLLERDRRLGLEFESSTFLFFVLDRLVALFPEARFITLVRHPGEWLDSLFRHLRSGRMPADARAFMLEGIGTGANEAEAVEALLRFWNRHLQSALEQIPPERHLVLETADLDRKAPRALAEFLGLPGLETSRPGRHNASEGSRAPRAWDHLIAPCCPLWSQPQTWRPLSESRPGARP